MTCKIARAEAGMALVEMCLILPVLIVLTFGIIEYGWMFMKAHDVTSASREGARAGAVAYATNAEALAAVNRILNAAHITGANVTISPAVDGLATGEPFTVSVTVSYAALSLLGMPFIPVPASLRASTGMAKEGP